MDSTLLTLLEATQNVQDNTASSKAVSGRKARGDTSFSDALQRPDSSSSNSSSWENVAEQGGNIYRSAKNATHESGKTAHSNNATWQVAENVVDDVVNNATNTVQDTAATGAQLLSLAQEVVDGTAGVAGQNITPTVNNGDSGRMFLLSITPEVETEIGSQTAQQLAEGASQIVGDGQIKEEEVSLILSGKLHSAKADGTSYKDGVVPDIQTVVNDPAIIQAAGGQQNVVQAVADDIIHIAKESAGTPELGDSAKLTIYVTLGNLLKK